MPFPGKLYRVYWKRPLHIGETEEDAKRRRKKDTVLFFGDGNLNFINLSIKNDIVMFLSFSKPVNFPYCVLYKDIIGFLPSNTIFEKVKHKKVKKW